jgi:D-glycero-beta-D-manno-heptose 1-phosphate adenylyltransferase
MINQIKQKIQDWKTIAKTVDAWKSQGYEVVFTNGCFDILHYGHLHYLCDAKNLGDKLVVGLNSATSVSRLKGAHRPINDELTRQYLLVGLECVDALVVFEQDTPLELIALIQPDILVKGGDWTPDQIVGSEIVLANGGEVLSLPFQDGYSTTNIETKIKEQKSA